MPHVPKRKTKLVRCDIDEIELEGDYDMVSGVKATCPRCGHTTESFGTEEPSIKRCLVLLREECPLAERNFYIAPDHVEYGPEI